MDPFALYIHIPFCAHKCPYCDFNTYAVQNPPEADYCTALIAELGMRAGEPAWRGRSPATIFFGGGTPSLFAPSSIQRIIDAVREHFSSDRLDEVTLEANPGTVSQESLAGYLRAGVNRLSFGTQSFNRSTLKQLGRIHTVADNIAAVRDARSAGFQNLNLDLIFGCPEQHPDDLRQDLAAALELLPEHLSIYGLTIEKGTPFYNAYHSGKLNLAGEETLAEMFECVIDTLIRAGFEHYEISNFARAEKRARHNLAYWQGNDYLGLGAGAHSYCRADTTDRRPRAERWSNYALPGRYIESATSRGSAVSWRDLLTASDMIFEFFFLGLRCLDGVDILKFERRFGPRCVEPYERIFERLRAAGLVDRSETVLRLTRRGILLADSVFEQLIPEIDKEACDRDVSAHGDSAIA